MTTPLQGRHFFDRVPPSDSSTPQLKTAYLYYDPVKDRYYVSDTVIPGATRAYLVDQPDGSTRLTTDPTGARTAALYGTNTVQL